MDLIRPELCELKFEIIRSWMILIMVLIGPELSELSAPELENWPYLTLFIL